MKHEQPPDVIRKALSRSTLPHVAFPRLHFVTSLVSNETAVSNMVEAFLGTPIHKKSTCQLYRRKVTFAGNKYHLRNVSAMGSLVSVISSTLTIEPTTRRGAMIGADGNSSEAAAAEGFSITQLITGDLSSTPHCPRFFQFAVPVFEQVLPVGQYSIMNTGWISQLLCRIRCRPNECSESNIKTPVTRTLRAF